MTNAISDTFLGQRLLYAYYRSGEFENALKVCRSIPGKDRSLFATQIEVSILEDIRDIPGASKVCEEYLSFHPDDIPMRLRFAVSLLRLGKIEQLDRLLDLKMEVSSLSLEIGLQFASLYAERGRSLECLQLAYELRRRFFNSGEAHLKYIGLFFTREPDVERALDNSVVRTDTAVCITDGGNGRWYIIEDRPDAEGHRIELRSDEPLAVKPATTAPSSRDRAV